MGQDLTTSPVSSAASTSAREPPAVRSATEPSAPGRSCAWSGERDQIGVRGQDRVGRGHERCDAGDRILDVQPGRLDGGEQVVEQVVEDLGLALDVAVEGIGRDLQAAGKRAHRQGIGAALGDQLARRGEHGRVGQPGALTGGSRRLHEPYCTPFS